MWLFSKSHNILSMTSGGIMHWTLTFIQAPQYSLMYRVSKGIANTDVLSCLLLLHAPGCTMCLPLRQCFFVGNCHVSLYSAAVLTLERKGACFVLYVLCWNKAVSERWMHSLGERKGCTFLWLITDAGMIQLKPLSWKVSKTACVVIQHRQGGREGCDFT